MEEQTPARRQFSSEDKAEAVNRHVVKGDAVSKICDDLGIAISLRT